MILLVTGSAPAPLALACGKRHKGPRFDAGTSPLCCTPSLVSLAERVAGARIPSSYPRDGHIFQETHWIEDVSSRIHPARQALRVRLQERGGAPVVRSRFEERQTRSVCVNRALRFVARIDCTCHTSRHKKPRTLIARWRGNPLCLSVVCLAVAPPKLHARVCARGEYTVDEYSCQS